MASSLVSQQPNSRTKKAGWRRLVFGVKNVGNRELKRASTTSLQGVPLLLGTIVTGMTIFGCIMVLSASSVEMITQGLSPFSQAIRQIIFGLIGFVLMIGLAYIPVPLYRNKHVLAIGMGIMCLLQVLVMVVGKDVNGNRNWLQMGSFQFQPSEIAKLATVLWAAFMLKRQGDISKDPWRAFAPIALVAGPLLLLILAGDDVGTVLVYAVILFVMIWASGLSRRATITTIILGILLAAFAMMSSTNRRSRVLAIFGDCQGSICDQSNSGLAALASGGFWGVGLGQSRQKYNYLPEAHNDYIFAVIGEELGLLGTCLVILFYLGLIYCAVRIIARSADRFVQLTSTGILTWLVFQALINIMMVTGLAPVIGVPLPFISYGGSSLVSALLAAGVLMGFARQTPLKSITGGDDFLFTSVREPHNADSKRRLPLGRIVAQENLAGLEAGWLPAFEIRRFIRGIAESFAGSTATSSDQRVARGTGSQTQAKGGRGNRPTQPRSTAPAGQAARQDSGLLDLAHATRTPKKQSSLPVQARSSQRSNYPASQGEQARVQRGVNQPKATSQRNSHVRPSATSPASVPAPARTTEQAFTQPEPVEAKPARRIPAGLVPVKKIREAQRKK